MVQVRLPEVEEVAKELPRRDASPLDLYRAYCQRRYQAAPDPAVLEAFSELWDAVETAGGGGS
jgi:hypothetical protein